MPTRYFRRMQPRWKIDEVKSHNFLLALRAECGLLAVTHRLNPLARRNPVADKILTLDKTVEKWKETGKERGRERERESTLWKWSHRLYRRFWKRLGSLIPIALLFHSNGILSFWSDDCRVKLRAALFNVLSGTLSSRSGPTSYSANSIWWDEAGPRDDDV